MQYSSVPANGGAFPAGVTDQEVPRLKKQLTVSACLALPLLVLTADPLAERILSSGGSAALWYGLVQLALALPVCVVDRDCLVPAWHSLRARRLDAGVFTALAAAAAMLYGAAGLLMTGAALAAGDTARAAQLCRELSFATAAMLLTLVTAARLLAACALSRIADASRTLRRQAPQEACLLREGRQVTVPVSQVQVGDQFLVRPGECIPVDGIVTQGVSSVNEEALTGSSEPVDKFPGSCVCAATVNQNGALSCRATRVGQDTALARTLRLMQASAATRPPMADRTDKAAALLAGAVLGLAALSFAVCLLLGTGLTFALGRAMAVLAAGCPGALALSVPLAFAVGSRVGARSGILFKTAAALETIGGTGVVMLDKAGTITSGEPTVVEVVGTRKVPARFLLGMAAGLELRSDHPLARAVLKKAEEEKITYSRLSAFETVPGKGLRGKLAGKELLGGSRAFVEEHCDVPDDLAQAADRMEAEGITTLFFGLAGHAAGIIGVSDVVRTSSRPAIGQMQQLGMEVVLLTADNRTGADHLASQLDLPPEQVLADVQPADKEALVRSRQSAGRVAMVGSGAGDAAALRCADTGLVLGAGEDQAVEAAGVVLLRSDLAEVPAAVRLSRAVHDCVRQNLLAAAVCHAVLLPLAAGLLAPLGILLDPIPAAALMCLFCVGVIANILRLDRFDPKDAGRDAPPRRKPEKNPKEETAMKKTVHIEGMMCPHCEATVKKALEAVEGVSAAQVSHQAGTAVVEMSAPVADTALKAAVEAKDYAVTGID